MGKVIPIDRRAMRREQVPVPSDIIDTGPATMFNLAQREQLCRTMMDALALLEPDKAKRAERALSSMEFESTRLAALLGEDKAIDAINARVIKRLAERIQP